MDNYSKYGLLAAGAIGLYIASKKGALGDDVQVESSEQMNEVDSSLMGLKKRRKGKKTTSKKHKRKHSRVSGVGASYGDCDLLKDLQYASSDLHSYVRVIDAFYDSWEKIQREGDEIMEMGYNDRSGNVYLALESGVTIASMFGQRVCYYVVDSESGEETCHDNYDRAYKSLK